MIVKPPRDASQGQGRPVRTVWRQQDGEEGREEETRKGREERRKRRERGKGEREERERRGGGGKSFFGPFG
jgi:hypothetical protein